MTQNDYRAKWDDCRELIRQKIESRQYSTWFQPLTFASYNAEKKELRINAPSHFFNEYISSHFAKEVLDALKEGFDDGVKLFFRQVTDKTNGQIQTTEIEKDREQRTTTTEQVTTTNNTQGNAKRPELDSHLIAEYTFDTFIQGTSNMLLRSVGISIAENPKQTTFNPLFIYGHSGVGKTHLVNAIGKAIKDMHPYKRVLYLSANLFQQQYVSSVKNNTTNDFMRFYQQIDVLIIDDIQEFATQTKTQNTFFHIFNHLKQNGKQIIMTCDRPPTELQGMEERLLTRFKWGLSAELEQPDEKLRRGILVNKIHRNGLNIPKDVIDYISKNVTDSVRSLEGVINSLLAHSVVYNSDITLNMAERIVGKAIRLEKKPITIDEIIDHTCAMLNVNKNDIFSATRKANVVQARQIAMYLTQRLTDMSTNKIGAYIGGRNHATVLHSINTVKDLMNTDNRICTLVNKIEQNIRQHKPIDK